MPQVVVTIAGKTYRMACDEGQESHLEALADRFDRTMRQLKDAFGTIGDQRLTVMTAIMVMDELVDAEAKIAELTQQLDGGNANAADVETANGDESGSGDAVRAAADRIRSLAEAVRSL